MDYAASLSNYFTDMGFYHNQKALGRSLLNKKARWTIVVYLLVSLGIFCRQITSFPVVDLNPANIKVSIFLASMIIGFAILPYVMRRISKNKPNPSLEHTLSAFGIGFFIDLASSQLIRFFS
jgi:hypothetical protein